MIEANTLIGLANVLLQLKNLSINKKRGKIKISAKHLVFISTNAIEDLLAGNVDMLKGPRTEAIFHCENAIYNFAKKAYRPPFKRGKVFSKWEDTPVYREKPNNVSMVQRKMNKQLFLQELREKDPLINEYICTSINNNEGDFNYSEYLKINYIEDLCGGSGIIECYELRPIFLVALWIENLDEKPIKLRNYSGKLYYPNPGFDSKRHILSTFPT